MARFIPEVGCVKRFFRDRVRCRRSTLAAIDEAVEALGEDCFLLARDADEVIARAERQREQW